MLEISIEECLPDDSLLQECRELYGHFSVLSVQLEIAGRFLDWARPRSAQDEVLLVAQPDTLYAFLGDVHGSFSSMCLAYLQARKMAEEGGCRLHLILLGDYMDRGEGDLAVLAFLQAGLMGELAPTVQLTCLSGNHDLALEQDWRGNCQSAVRPADTSEHLNALLATGPSGAALTLGRAATTLASISPVVAELTGVVPGEPDLSLLLAHACTPHTDLQAELRESISPVAPGCGLFSSLPFELMDKCRVDLTGGRFNARVKSCPPRRGFGSAAQGREDVQSWLNLHEELTGRQPLGLVRGHEHIPAGYSLSMLSNGFVLTLNTMDGTAVSAPELIAALAVWQPGEPLRVLTFCP